MTSRSFLAAVSVCLFTLAASPKPARAGMDQPSAAASDATDQVHMITVSQWLGETESLVAEVEAQAAALDQGAPRTTVNHRLTALLTRLSLDRQVSTAPGVVISVDSEWLRDELLEAMQAATPHLQVRKMRDLSARLRLLVQLGRPGPPRRFSGDVRALAAQILASPDFAGRKAGALDRLAELVGQILDRLAEMIFGGLVGKSAWQVVSAIGLILLGIAVLLVVAVVLRRLTTAGRRRWLEVPLERRPLPPDASSALARAVQAMEAGNVKESLRLLHLALLLALAGSGLLEFIPSRTNWEYVRVLAGRPEAETLSQATTLFERKYFGRQACTAQELALLRGWAEAAVRKSP